MTIRFWLKPFWLKLKLRLRACFACVHDLVFFGKNRMADMSERTMWKDDLHGLLLGASLVDLENRDSEDEVMRTLREKMASTIWKHEWDMFAYDPEVSTDPLEVQFLNVLSTMKQPRRILEIGVFTGYGAATMLKGCENATRVSPEIDSFLKPWVRDGLASMPNSTRREIEVGLALDTLEKMPSSESFELMSIDANKSGYMRYVEVLIARGLPANNAMEVDDNMLYCGFPSTLSESCFLEPTTRSNTTKDRNLIIPLFPGIVVFCASQSCPWIQSTWQIRTVQQSYKKWASSRTLMRSTTTRLMSSGRQST